MLRLSSCCRWVMWFSFQIPAHLTLQVDCDWQSRFILQMTVKYVKHNADGQILTAEHCCRSIHSGIVCLPLWIWMETSRSGTVDIVWWYWSFWTVTLQLCHVSRWTVDGSVYLSACISSSRKLWMLERERSGNAPPTKPRLSSWIFKSTCEICLTAQRPLSCRHSYVGYSGAIFMLYKLFSHS